MSVKQIKALAKSQKKKVEDLLALSPKNDPYYAGNPSSLCWANWLHRYWQEFGYTREIHIRRIHYQLISQPEPVLMPDGEPYENTMKCWKKLTEASKYLRYLGMIDCDQLIDRRSPPPLICHSNTSRWGEPLRSEPETGIDSPYQNGLELSDFEFPSLQGLPKLEYQELDPIQPYLMEIWCEKSTMNDILEPICQMQGANLVTGVGEISITRCDELARRVKAFAKPTRIFYLSDFDPAGQSMPVAVSRKIEWLLNGQGCDVKVFPLLLNLEQVQRYQLPRIPIKETERRASRFEERFGEGATELDSLEAIHPGELRRIILEAMEPYLQAHRVLRHGVRNFNQEQKSIIREINRDVHSRYQEEWDVLETRFDEVKGEFEAELRELFSRYQERVAELKSTRDELARRVEEDLTQIEEEITFPSLEPPQAEEDREPLLDTGLSYLDQLTVYKRFQGKQSA